MTDLRLALSASEPDVWSFPATHYEAVETLELADDFGDPLGDATSRTGIVVTDASFTLPYNAAADVYQQDILDDLLFSGTRLQSPSGLVTLTTSVIAYDGEIDLPSSTQTITANSPWNQIKDIAVSHLSTEALTISNFVDVQIDTGADPTAHVIDVEAAKRGSITALGSAEDVNVAYLSNEYSWSNTFNVTLGNGTNSFDMAPLLPYFAARVPSLTPMTFNTATQKTLLQLDTGDGQNSITTRECSASIHLGAGVNTVEMWDGHNEVWTSGGRDEISIFSRSPILTAGVATDIGTDLIHVGIEAASVFLDDTYLATMPTTTIEIAATPADRTAPVTTEISYGHYASGLQYGAYSGGDWTHLTIDLHGFAAGSHLSLLQQPIDGYSILSVQDAATGTLRVLDLTGGAPSLNQLHIVWS